MKELSIEEKARRYDEAVAMAKECITHIPDEAVNKYMLNMFPELYESEDERIRKELIKLLRNLFNNYSFFIKDPFYTECITWLEKQGEQKPIEWHREDEQNLNVCLSYIPDEFLRRWLKDIIHAKYDKFVDKVEPKFKVGDWIIDKQGLAHQIENVVENVTNHTFGYDIVGGGYFNDNSDVRLWTIEDAKDGDVLKEDSCIFIIEKMNPNGTAIVHCCLFDDGEFDLTGSTLRFDVDSTKPATKEQRNLLFQKMKDAGYEWDKEKKELELQ